jgi:hypothetical protein
MRSRQMTTPWWVPNTIKFWCTVRHEAANDVSNCVAWLESRWYLSHGSIISPSSPDCVSSSSSSGNSLSDSDPDPDPDPLSLPVLPDPDCDPDSESPSPLSSPPSHSRISPSPPPGAAARPVMDRLLPRGEWSLTSISHPSGHRGTSDCLVGDQVPRSTRAVHAHALTQSLTSPRPKAHFGGLERVRSPS